jgi:flagellin-like hook-associated protein FlgL
MSFRINMNYSAQIAQAHLLSNADLLQTSMGRLSSGLRITKASDDHLG